MTSPEYTRSGTPSTGSSPCSRVPTCGVASLGCRDRCCPTGTGTAGPRTHGPLCTVLVMSGLPPDPPRLRAILGHLERQIAETEAVGIYLRLQCDEVREALAWASSAPSRERPAQRSGPQRRPPSSAEYMMETKLRPDDSLPVVVHVGGCKIRQGAGRRPRSVRSRHAWCSRIRRSVPSPVRSADRRTSWGWEATLSERPAADLPQRGGGLQSKTWTARRGASTWAWAGLLACAGRLLRALPGPEPPLRARGRHLPCLPGARGVLRRRPRRCPRRLLHG